MFNYTDHLGNIRLRYTSTGLGNVIQKLEENHYYPFGLKHKKYNSYQYVFVALNEIDGYDLGIDPLPESERDEYQYKYNGKEWQDELGLNTYDYGFRQYMPDIGRFGNIDMMAELAYDQTPNRYAFNNPLRYIDPLGLWEITANGDYTTNDPNDIKRFISYLEVENYALNNTPDSKQMSSFIDGEMSPGGHGKTSDGTVLADEVTINVYKQVGGGIKGYADEKSFSNFWHGVQRSLTPDALDTRTIGQNLLGLTYPGGENPKTYSGKYDYSYVPSSLAEYPAIGHDRRYDKLGTAGASGLLGDTRAIGADWRFVGQELAIASMPIPIKQRIQAGILGIGLGLASLPKTVVQLGNPYNGGLGTVCYYGIVFLGKELIMRHQNKLNNMDNNIDEIKSKSSKKAFYYSLVYVGLGTLAVLCSYPPYYGDWVLFLLLLTFPVSILGFAVMMAGKYYLFALFIQIVTLWVFWAILKKILYKRYLKNQG